MYTEIQESLTLESRDKIRFSLLSLMDQRPYSDITIAEICHAAKVSRQTYYRLFSSKDDILILHLNEMMKEYLLPRILLDNPSANDFLQFFLFFAEYKDLLKILYRNDKMYLLQHVLTRYPAFPRLTFISLAIFHFSQNYLLETENICFNRV